MGGSLHGSGGFSLLVRILGECSAVHYLPVLFFFCSGDELVHT